MRRHIVRLPVVLLLSFACATVVWAFSTGPVASRTSARALGAYPAETNCTQCHSSFPINDPNGLLEILDVPAAYIPGQTYPLRVRLSYSLSDTTGSSNPKWGFQLTAIKAADGTGAGTLVTPPPGPSPTYPDSLQIKVPTSGTYLGSGRQYIEHTSFSTRTDQPNPVEWSFSWTAPPADVGMIYFFAAGNAANGDFSSSGDHIFTAAESTVAVLLAAPNAPATTTLALAAPRPNPARDGTALDYALPRPASIDLAIFDAQGRRVRTLVRGSRPAGAATARWDGRAESGTTAPAGTYFARLRSGDAPPVLRRLTLTH